MPSFSRLLPRSLACRTGDTPPPQSRPEATSRWPSGGLHAIGSRDRGRAETARMPIPQEALRRWPFPTRACVETSATQLASRRPGSAASRSSALLLRPWRGEPKGGRSDLRSTVEVINLQGRCASGDASPMPSTSTASIVVDLTCAWLLSSRTGGGSVSCQ